MAVESSTCATKSPGSPKGDFIPSTRPYHQLTDKFRLLVGKNLVEDMVASLSLQLEGDSGLFQQIWNRSTGPVRGHSAPRGSEAPPIPLSVLTSFNICRSQLSGGAEMDADELALRRGRGRPDPSMTEQRPLDS